jgi:hypothetical protein
LAFGELQFGKLQAAFDEMRKTDMPVPAFLRSLGPRMTQEHMRNPSIIRILLQAFLADTAVREPMLELQRRVSAIHTELMRIGQERGEIRDDVPPAELAQVFRQNIFGTLLIWSLYEDSTLLHRMEQSFEVLWTGLAPRTELPPPAASDSAAAWLHWGLMV